MATVTLIQESVGEPNWFSHRDYPFEPKYLVTEGGRMHYVDVGEGSPVLFLHGTPTWSYLWRGAITALQESHRCVAPDLIGAGMSDKRPTWSYSPTAHMRNIRMLMDELDLEGITLVASGMGGPIGLALVQEQPGRFDRVVLSNTWAWSLKGLPPIERIYRIATGPIGRLLSMDALSSRHLMRQIFGYPPALTPELERAYAGPLTARENRLGIIQQCRQLIDASPFYHEIWEDLGPLRDKEFMFLWGMKDPLFGELSLARFWREFPMAEVVRFPNAGHLPIEEESTAFIEHLRKFTGSAPASIR